MARQAKRLLTEWTFDGEVREQRDFYLPVDVQELYIDLNLRRTYLKPDTPETPSQVTPEEPKAPTPTEPYLPPPSKQYPIDVEPKPIDPIEPRVTDDGLVSPDPIDRGYTPASPSQPVDAIDDSFIDDGGSKIESDGIDYVGTKEPSGTTVEYDAGIADSPTGYTDAGTEYIPPPAPERYPEEEKVLVQETVYYDKEQELLEAEVMAEKSVSTTDTTTTDVADVISPTEVSTTKVDYTETTTQEIDVGISADTPVYNQPTEYHEEVDTVTTSTDTGQDLVDDTPEVTSYVQPPTIEETTYVESPTEYQTADEPVKIDTTSTSTTSTVTTTKTVDRTLDERATFGMRTFDIEDFVGLKASPPARPDIDISVGDLVIPSPDALEIPRESAPRVAPSDIVDEPSEFVSRRMTASTPSEHPEIDTAVQQPPAPTKYVQPKKGGELARDYYSVMPLRFTLFVDGRPIFAKELTYYPSQLNYTHKVTLPSALRAGKHVFAVSMSTTRAIYKGDVRVEYELPPVQAWSSDKPPETPDLPTVPTPPEIPNPIQMVQDWWSGVVGTLFPQSG